jgi:hypothetical protein
VFSSYLEFRTMDKVLKPSDSECLDIVKSILFLMRTQFIARLPEGTQYLVAKVRIIFEQIGQE